MSYQISKFSKFFMLLMGICLIPRSGSAERVSVETARCVAVNAVKNIIPDTRSAFSLDLVYAAEPLSIEDGTSNAVIRGKNGGGRAGTPALAETPQADFFIFNISGQDGFVIVSGEDRVHPILGYSENRSFRIEDMPDNLREWLKGYQEQIAYAVRQDLQPSDELKAEWAAYLEGTVKESSRKLVLETAEWGQDKPYNLECQVVPGKVVPCGCVATAMAIIMKYNEWPDKAENGILFYEGKEVAYKAYDWGKMLPSYEFGSYTDEEGQAVADLIWNIGANVEMDYHPAGSGAYSSFVPAALRNVFRYSKKSAYRLKADYADWEWADMLRNELKNDRPVYYSGVGRSGGHAFVCDGYNGSLFHFNWGWEGYCNGFFVLSTLDAMNDGDGFPDQQDCVCIEKPGIDDDYLYEIRYINDIVCHDDVQAGRPITVYFKIYNSGSTDLEGEVAVAVVDGSDYTVKKIVSTLPDHLMQYELEEGIGFYKEPLGIPVMLDAPLEKNEYLMVVNRFKGQTEWSPLCSMKYKDRIGPDGPVCNPEAVSPETKSFKVTADLSGLKAELPEEVGYGQTLVTTLICEPGYELPEAVEVRIDDELLDESDYTYNVYHGVLVIPDITGDVVIQAQGASYVANEVLQKENFVYKVVDRSVYLTTPFKESVSVYDPSGHCLYRRQVEGGAVISLPGSGVYFLVVGDRSFKLVV